MKTTSIILVLYFATYVNGKPAPVKPPKALQETEIWADEDATLQCLGDRPIFWTFKEFGLTTILSTKHNVPRFMHSATSSEGEDGYNITSTLKLSSNHHHLQGFYYCHYDEDQSDKNLSNGNNSEELYVYLSSKEAYIANPETSDQLIFVEEGDSLILDCRATIPNATVIVSHEEDVIWTAPLEKPRLGYVIRSISDTSAGSYQCYVKGDEDFAERFKLNVKSPVNKPYIGFKDNHIPMVGQDLQLTCKIIQQLSKPTFKWTLPNPSADHSISDVDDYLGGNLYHMSYLTVQNLTLEDSGNYSCLVAIENKIPSRQVKKITVQDAPELTTEASSQPEDLINLLCHSVPEHRQDLETCKYEVNCLDTNETSNILSYSHFLQYRLDSCITYNVSVYDCASGEPFSVFCDHSQGDGLKIMIIIIVIMITTIICVVGMFVFKRRWRRPNILNISNEGVIEECTVDYAHLED